MVHTMKVMSHLLKQFKIIVAADKTYPFKHSSFLIDSFSKFKSSHSSNKLYQENAKSKNIGFLRWLASG